MPGAICTFIILLMTAVFAINSYRILAQRQGTLFTATTLKKFNDKSNAFTEEDGFQVAFAVIDQNTADYTDKAGRELSEYLEVTVSLGEYDESNSENKYSITTIQTHPCTEAELGLDDSGTSKFESIIEEDRELIVKTKPLFQCFDQADV